MNPVVHFEMGAYDRERMKKFYGHVFGWQSKQMGPEMGNYVVVMTTESDEKGPKVPGVINGGFYMKTDDPGSQAPSFVISVEDLDESMKMVERAGGKILSKKPEDIPGVGRWISFQDTEGNRVSMLQPAVKI
jgi:predicted enzyme related to lactoylglutathione lyase